MGKPPVARRLRVQRFHGGGKQGSLSFNAVLSLVAIVGNKGGGNLAGLAGRLSVRGDVPITCTPIKGVEIVEFRLGANAFNDGEEVGIVAVDEPTIVGDRGHVDAEQVGPAPVVHAHGAAMSGGIGRVIQSEGTPLRPVGWVAFLLSGILGLGLLTPGLLGLQGNVGGKS